MFLHQRRVEAAQAVIAADLDEGGIDGTAGQNPVQPGRGVGGSVAGDGGVDQHDILAFGA
jgi:hypothetical protein